MHFLAIGGAGMSGVARIMLARGIRVTGSDAKDVPVLKALESEGAGVWVGFHEGHQERADAIVMSSSIRDDNVELVAARERGVPVLHRAQGLAALMQGRRPVAVAGANGKTTTTSMLTVALQGCGLDPSFAVGGELAKHGTNAHDGSDDVFVVEADESDGSFVVYRPEVAIVTNVQPDHLDFYSNFTVVQAAYDAFVDTIRPGGLLVTCADDAGAVALAERARATGTRVVTYGFDPSVRRRPGRPPAGRRHLVGHAARRGHRAAMTSACPGATTRSTPRPRTPPPSTGSARTPTASSPGWRPSRGRAAASSRRARPGEWSSSTTTPTTRARSQRVVETAKSLVGDTRPAPRRLPAPPVQPYA